jgi:hypothetical protein
MTAADPDAPCMRPGLPGGGRMTAADLDALRVRARANLAAA